MSIFDRFRPADQSRGRTYGAQPVEPTEDEQALARYRYMLKTAPPETIGGATVAAIRYVRYAPGIRALTLRSGVVMFFASASFALLPTVAQNVSNSAVVYGILLGCFGAGAVGGADSGRRHRR